MAKRRRAIHRHSHWLVFELLEHRRLLAANPVITEFMASNNGFLEDGDGNTPDWIEIYNAGDASVDLAGYGLTDKPDNLSRWVFPSVSLDPNEYLVVFASRNERDNYLDDEGNLHTNFALSAGGEYLALVSPGETILSEFGTAGRDYPQQRANVSYGVAQQVLLVGAQSDAAYLIPTDDVVDDVWTEIGFDEHANGFAFDNAALGYETRPDYRYSFNDAFLTILPPKTHAVYVRADFHLQDTSQVRALTLRMMYDDGFIAYLNGVKIAESGAPPNPQWFSFSPQRRNDNEALEFVRFDLSDHLGTLVQGSNVLAIHGLNNGADTGNMLLVPELTATVISPSAEIGYMTAPTPGAVNVGNDKVYSGFVSDLQFSVQRGFVDEPVDVTVQTDTPGAAIRYATDGRAPTATTGIPYTGPIRIDTTTTLQVAAFKNDLVPSVVQTHTYLFLHDVIRQPRHPPGFPETWKDRAADYEMDPTVVNDAAYRDEIIDGLKSIRTMSIVMNPGDLFGDNGIYSNPMRRGRDWERPASIEIIDPAATETYQATSGIRIHGASTRNPSRTRKHSFRLEFRDQYGPTKLVYPLFPDAPVGRFDSIVLRGPLGSLSYMLNTFARDTARDMEKVDGHATYVHLYLNGLYWGLYNPFERPDAQMAEEYFGGSDEDYDALHSPGFKVVDGDGERFSQLLLLGNSTLPDDAWYAEVQRYVDIDNLIDFILINEFMGIRRSEARAIGSRVGDPNFRFFVWDLEFGTHRVEEFGLFRVEEAFLRSTYSRLRQHSEFRLRFADHVQRHLFNDGALTSAATAARWKERADEIFSAVVAESARWGDALRFHPLTWQMQIDRELAKFFPQRTQFMIRALQKQKLYPNVAAPVFNQHGGTVATRFELSIVNPNGDGALYYTLDGSDPRIVGGGISPTALVHNGGPIALTSPVHVKSRVLFDGEWSALNEASFAVEDSPESSEAGDANRDSQFDQVDIVQVLQAGKFMTAEPATWEEGDWNTDRIFDQLDIVAALQTGNYLVGPYAAHASLDSAFVDFGTMGTKNSCLSSMPLSSQSTDSFLKDAFDEAAFPEWL